MPATGAAVADVVTVRGVLEGVLELRIPELGRQRVGSGEWYLLRDHTGKTLTTGSGEAQGVVVEMPVSALLGGRQAGLGTGLACLECPVRDAAYFVRGQCSGRVRQLLQELTHWQGTGRGDDWLRQSRLTEWIALILDQPELGERAGCCRHDRCCEVETVEAVAATLREELAETPTIRDLARQHYTNECKLKVQFRRHFGTTIHGYLRQQRMQHARGLLEAGTCGVMRVAQEVGYSNASHFARAFREVHGINPQVVARRQRNGVADGPTRAMHMSPLCTEAKVEGAGLSWSI